MTTYTELSFAPIKEETSNNVIALLSTVGYHGFEMQKDRLNAYIDSELFEQQELMYLHDLFPHLEYEKKIIREQNWNEQWESSFEPVVVRKFAAIRADFHDPIVNVEHEIIITPKMSFGTGHHATTALVIELMEDVDFVNRTVLDFGTGTGVLAILAEKLGALHVSALDNDHWSIENARENILKNQCLRVNVFEASEISAPHTADIILANINLNVLKSALPCICKHSTYDADILFSGLLVSDREPFTALLQNSGYQIEKLVEKNGWIAIHARCNVL